MGFLLCLYVKVQKFLPKFWRFEADDDFFDTVHGCRVYSNSLRIFPGGVGVFCWVFHQRFSGGMVMIDWRALSDIRFICQHYRNLYVFDSLVCASSLEKGDSVRISENGTALSVNLRNLGEFTVRAIRWDMVKLEQSLTGVVIKLPACYVQLEGSEGSSLD